METLRFTPRTIHEIENQKKQPLTEVIRDSSIGTLALFIKKGLILRDDNEALDMIGKWLDEGENLETIHLAIVEVLIDARFLSPMPELAQVKERLMAAKATMSAKAGNKTKDSQ